MISAVVSFVALILNFGVFVFFLRLVRKNLELQLAAIDVSYSSQKDLPFNIALLRYYSTVKRYPAFCGFITAKRVIKERELFRKETAQRFWNNVEPIKKGQNGDASRTKQTTDNL